MLICNRLLILVLPFLLVYSLVAADRELTHLSLKLVGVSVLLAIVLWMMVARLRCPLCIGLPLAINGSVKSRRARRLFGSYRFRVALAILTKGHFRCPYCGEYTAVEARRPRYR